MQVLVYDTEQEYCILHPSRFAAELTRQRPPFEKTKNQIFMLEMQREHERTQPIQNRKPIQKKEFSKEI